MELSQEAYSLIYRPGGPANHSFTHSPLFMELVAQILLLLMGLYLAVGLIMSVFLLRRGIATYDDGVRRTPLLFKLLIWPGVVALWLPLFIKWRKAL